LRTEDCHNPDPRAVSGCAHVLPTGQLVRFRWKANVPTLEEFARDALFNESGLTVRFNLRLRVGKSVVVPSHRVSTASAR
jgi:hypothetical protein